MEELLKMEAFLDEQIKKIDDDERYHYKPANVLVNAPLALIQVGLSEQMSILNQCKQKIAELKRL